MRFLFSASAFIEADSAQDALAKAGEFFEDIASSANPDEVENVFKGSVNLVVAPEPEEPEDNGA